MSSRNIRTRQSRIDASPPLTRKGISPTRSPARKRKTSPTVRETQKSPSRKSPGRKSATIYPVRKSPSRAAKEKQETKESSVPKSPAKRPAIKKDIKIQLDSITSKVEILRNTRSKRIDYSIKDVSSVITLDSNFDDKLNGLGNLNSESDTYVLRSRKNIDDILPRRSSRLRDVLDSVPDIRRSLSKSLSKSISKSVSKSIDTYSDDENPIELESREKSQSITRKLATPSRSSVTLSQLSNRYEFGGLIGSVGLYVLIPLTILYILVSCSKSCSHLLPEDLITFKSASYWFNVQLSLLVITNYCLQAIFLSLPVFGTKEVDEHGKKYCFNAFFSCLCTFVIIFMLDYFKVLNIDLLLNSYLKMATTSYLIALFLTIVVYSKSLKVNSSQLNPYASSGNFLYDFFIGRQIHCNFMKINVKLWLARVSNITALIFTILIFKRGFYIQLTEIDNITLDKIIDIVNKLQIKPTILVYCMMQMMYLLYFIIKEKKIVSTFYWHSEGLGYLQIVCSSLYPFYFTTISKHVADGELVLSNNVLIAASLLYLLGFVIMLISNNIKHEFRKNPLQPSLTHLDSMPTFHGKKLLVSNLWGILRHPNYLGDIMIHIVLALPGMLSHHLIASIPAVITIIVLVHRAWRDHDRCRRRYGAAWQRYCKRVPSVIIPKIL